MIGVNGLTKRLEKCAEAVGGKRALARLSGISEAQFARYIKGSHDVPYSKIIKIAKVSKQNAEWLLTGKVSSNHPQVEYELIGNVLAELTLLQTMLNQALAELKEKIGAARKQAYINVLLAAGIVQKRQGLETPYANQIKLRRAMVFLKGFSLEELELYQNLVIEYAFQEGGLSEAQERYLAELIDKATLTSFEGDIGQEYYTRVGFDLSQTYRRLHQTMVEKIVKENGNKIPKQILDIGCGNGRHLKYCQSIWPDIRFVGVEESNAGFALCQQLVKAKEISAENVHQFALNAIDLPSESFDVVCLNFVAYLLWAKGKKAKTLESVLAEAKRLLRPGGFVQILAHEWQGIEFIPFERGHTYESVAQFFPNYALIHKEKVDFNNIKNDTYLCCESLKRYGPCLQFILRKPL